MKLEVFKIDFRFFFYFAAFLKNRKSIVWRKFVKNSIHVLRLLQVAKIPKNPTVLEVFFFWGTFQQKIAKIAINKTLRIKHISGFHLIVNLNAYDEKLFQKQLFYFGNALLLLLSQ